MSGSAGNSIEPISSAYPEIFDRKTCRAIMNMSALLRSASGLLWRCATSFRSIDTTRAGPRSRRGGWGEVGEGPLAALGAAPPVVQADRPPPGRPEVEAGWLREDAVALDRGLDGALHGARQLRREILGHPL